MKMTGMQQGLDKHFGSITDQHISLQLNWLFKNLYLS